MGKEKSAADLRATLIRLHMLVTQACDAHWKVDLLLQSIVRAGEVLYAPDSERCPKLLLRLYNNLWLHHQLCYDLFKELKSTRDKFFGLYLHSLSKHAAEQYELVCLIFT